MDKLRLELMTVGTGLAAGSVFEDRLAWWAGMALIGIGVVIKVVVALRQRTMKP